MTLYGVDISNVNGSGLSIADMKSEGFGWVEAKVSQGSYFTDETWPGYLADANACGMPIIGYHFADATSAPVAQAQTFVANNGGRTVMIDFESGAGNIGDYWALVGAFNAVGVTVALTYLPRWYWLSIGSPDLSQVPGLVSSNYPAGAGYASGIYAAAGGDSGPGWASYGGAAPQIWQFTDQASIAGSTLDANAFRGTVAELDALLNGEEDMELTDTLTNAAGDTVTVGQILTAIDFHASMSLEQQAGPGTSEQPGPSLTATGWPQLAGHSIVDALAVIGAKLDIPGFQAPGSAA